MELPPLELFRARGPRVPARAREGRAPRHDRVLEVRGHGTRRRGLARRSALEPRPQKDRAHRAELSADQIWWGALGVHGVSRGTGPVLSGLRGCPRAARLRLSDEAPARRRRRQATTRDTDVWRAGARRTALARPPAEAHRHRA